MRRIKKMLVANAVRCPVMQWCVVGVLLRIAR